MVIYHCNTKPKRVKSLNKALRFLMLVSTAALAGDPVTLQDALRSARKNSHDILVSNAQVDAADAEYQKTLSLFLPRLAVSETWLKTNDPLTVFGLKLKQERVTAADFNPASLNNPDALGNFATRGEFQQPLLNIDGWFGRQAARDATQSARHLSTRTTHHMEYEIQKVYFAWVVARRSLVVMDRFLQTARAGREQAEKYRQQGLIHESDVLLANVRLLDVESRKEELQTQMLYFRDTLKRLTGLTGDIEPSDTLTVPVDAVWEPALNSSRSDVRAMEASLRAAKNMRRRARASFLPSVNAFGSYEWNDHRIGARAQNWMVGVSIHWNILSGMDQIAEWRKSAAQIRTIELQLQNLRDRNRDDLAEASRQRWVMKKKTDLAAESVRQSREHLRIVEDRYRQGLERTPDFLLAQSTAEQADIQYLHAVYGYHVALFTIQYLTEQDIQ